MSESATPPNDFFGALPDQRDALLFVGDFVRILNNDQLLALRGLAQAFGGEMRVVGGLAGNSIRESGADIEQLEATEAKPITLAGFVEYAAKAGYSSRLAHKSWHIVRRTHLEGRGDYQRYGIPEIDYLDPDKETILNLWTVHRRLQATDGSIEMWPGATSKTLSFIGALVSDKLLAAIE